MITAGILALAVTYSAATSPIVPGEDISYAQKFAKPNRLSKTDIRLLMKHVAKDKGITLTTSELDAGVYIIWKECHGRAWLKNSRSSAFGLPQGLKSTYKNYGYASAWGKTLPYTQMKLFFDYVKDRYKTFQNAKNHHQRKNWY